MPGGIDISQNAAAMLAKASVAASAIVEVGVLAVNYNQIPIPTIIGPYRSPVQNKAAVYGITVTTSGVSSSSFNPNLAVDPAFIAANNATAFTTPATSTMYVFDAVLQVSHDQSLRLTKHPLQYGYNISDHAVLQEAHVVLEIGMSDAMAAFASGMWEGNASKSVSAFQTLIGFMQNRQLLTLSTRQKTYSNMMITNVTSPETNKTFRSLKARVTFEQVFLVNLATQTMSARPNATDATQLATVQPTNVPATVIQQNQVSGIDPTTNYGAAGSFSSNPIAQILTRTNQGVPIP